MKYALEDQGEDSRSLQGKVRTFHHVSSAPSYLPPASLSPGSLIVNTGLSGSPTSPGGVGTSVQSFLLSPCSRLVLLLVVLLDLASSYSLFKSSAPVSLFLRTKPCLPNTSLPAVFPPCPHNLLSHNLSHFTCYFKKRLLLAFRCLLAPPLQNGSSLETGTFLFFFLLTDERFSSTE